MKAEIISIGTEITTGNTVNTNASFISYNLLDIGIETYYQTSVSDDMDMVKEVLDIALKRADLIITTGGLGPTEDDMTKEIVADFFNLDLIFEEDMKEIIVERLSKYNRVPENNFKQAYRIDGSQFLENIVGTAPGTFLEKDGKIIILLPGPPREMEGMFINEAMPLLRNDTYHIISRSVNIFGIGESALEMEIKDLIHRYKDIDVATFSKPNNIEIKIMGRGKSEEALTIKIKEIIQELNERFEKNIYSYDKITLEETIFNMLRERNLIIGFCESCTGGLVSGNFARIPGVSEVFDRSFVTYSNQAKMEEVGVEKATLDKYGAVSEETAEEMVDGVLRREAIDIAVSITGIAGPDSDSTEKPVGLIYVCIKSKDKVKNIKLNLNGSRKDIQDRVVRYVFQHVREFILENY